MTDAEDAPLSVGDGLAEFGEFFLVAMLVGTGSLSFIFGGGLYVYLHHGAPTTAESGVSWALVPAVLIWGVLAVLGLIEVAKDAVGYARRAWARFSSDSEPTRAATDGGHEDSAETAGGDRNRQQTPTKHN